MYNDNTLAIIQYIVDLL